MDCPKQLEIWVPRAPDQLILSLMFPCMTPEVEDCFSDNTALPDINWLREEVREGRVQMFGEVISELHGVFPGDPLLEPFFALAEEFDIPFGLHMGPGPEWLVESTSIYSQLPDFQISAGNPLELESAAAAAP